MESKTLTLLVLTLCICVQLSQQQQRIPRCLLSRMDFMPCQYRNPNLDMASQNEYSIHYTRLKSSDSGSAECLVRPKNQEIREITTSGSVNTKIIYSPGFILDADYDNQLLAQYNIDCGEGRLAYFNVTTLDMQGDGDCSYETRPRCQDYILIDRGVGGTTEICGNTTSDDSTVELESGKFTVFFRSSEKLKFRGFEMYIICFRQNERDLPGCLTPMDFNSTMCSAGSGSNNTDGKERKKRDAGYADGVTYDEYFPGYPSGLRMREDVANFHNQWRRQKRQADVGIRFVQRVVFFNESVNYTNSTIRIADTDGTETGLYKGVEVLQIFDATGEIVHYVGGVSSDLYPHFLGPGPLTIIDRYAFFQLFLIDPRGLIPNPEEEVELLRLNTPLLDAIPDSADFILNDTNPPFENLDFLLGRRRRSLTGVTQQSTNNTEFSEEALFVALRNREACNPVLRTQAMSAIQLYMEMNETRVNEMQNFTMNCSLSGKELNCSVAEGCAPALDKSNYCTINNDTSTRKKCDPFYGVFETEDTTITTVTVEAINCNGQRATEVVFQTDG